MHRKKRVKLALNRQTVRALNARQQGRAHGGTDELEADIGGSFIWCDSFGGCYTNTCQNCTITCNPGGCGSTPYLGC